MNTILALLLTVFGVTLLVKNKSASLKLRSFFSQRFNDAGGAETLLGSIDPNRPVNAFTYRLVVVFFAIFLILFAFNVAFGPIYTYQSSGENSILNVK